MEDINRFLGGINTDVHPSFQPENTVRHLLNFVPLSRDGNLYAITNEDGTVLMDHVMFPTGFKVIGYSVLNADVIVVLAHPSGFSQVGYIVEDSNPDPTYGAYHPVAPYDENTSSVPENNSEFGFQLANPVDCVSRKLINGHRILYFTDNLNPFGRVDLEEPPLVGNVQQEVKLTFNQTIPEINITRIQENATSTIRPGVVQFVTRYITEGGGTTTFGIPTNPLPMVPENRSVGPDNYHGEYYESQFVNKNVILEISNLDTQYTELELVAIYYQGTQSVFKASIIANLPITSDSIEFTYTGPDVENEVSITREEINQIPISYSRAKCIEQKDNTLFLSNLASDRSADNDLLQEIANGINVSYKIKEVEFSNRGENNTISSLAFVPASSPSITGSVTVSLTMTEDIDVTTGETVDRYLLKKPGTVASGTITIADSTQILDGDTILVDTSTGGAGLTQPNVTFTARTTPTIADEYQIVSGDNDLTAVNIATAINSSTNVTDYYAIVSSNVITLFWSTIDTDADGVAITITGLGITPSNFAGTTTTPFDEVPTLATVSGNTVDLNFANPPSTSDDLQIINGGISNTDLDETYETGTQGGLSLTTGGSSSTSSSFEAGFTDYTNEILTVDSKGYRRGEIYSLGIMLVYKDGGFSNVFHIPGNITVSQLGRNAVGTWPTFSQAPLSTERLGGYVSQLEYPNDQNYPGGLAGDDSDAEGPVGFERNIRHHYIPELENEPHYRVSGDTTFIRIIGLEYDFTKAIPQSILEDVQSIMFVRERRNNNENKSLFAQGLINRQVIMADNYDENGRVGGDSLIGGTSYSPIKSGYFAGEMHFFNNTEGVDFTGDQIIKGNIFPQPRTHGGMAYPDFVNAGYTGFYEFGTKLSTEILSTRAFFHSPETDLLPDIILTADEISAAIMRPEMKLFGDYSKVGDLGTDAWFYSDNIGKATDYLIGFRHNDYFGNYNDYEQIAVGPNDKTIQEARFADASSYRLRGLDPAEPSLKTSTRWTQGGLEVMVDTAFLYHGGSVFRVQNSIDIRNSQGICISDCGPNNRYAGDIFDSGSPAVTGDLTRYLYNIRREAVAQYGGVGIGNYIYMDRRSPFELNGSFKTSYNSVFGGDTFITKYAFNQGGLLPYFPYERIGGNNTRHSPDKGESRRSTGYAHIDGLDIGTDGNSGGPNKAHGWDFRATTYYMVESDINTHYRHQDLDSDEKQNYYPNDTNLSNLLNNYIPYFGNANAYNQQYSYENTIRSFTTRASVSELPTKFENRTIYSETAAEDDTLDSYRSLLVGNVYDLPSNTGPIWDTFVEFNNLFIHTTKSLWRAFAEPAATLQGGNISDVVLGTGSLFARPSSEMLTTEGGYAGTISQFGGTSTKAGYIFPDVLQGKIFMLGLSKNGPQLQELSENGLQTYMHKNLPIGLTLDQNGDVDVTNVSTENANLIDNPYNGIGLMGGYDHKLKRAWVVKNPTYDGLTLIDPGFTLSYSILLGKWMSYHSYTPSVIIPYDNRVFFIDNTNTSVFWEMNEGDKCSYFGQVYDSELEYVCAKGPTQMKTFQNLFVSSESFDQATNRKIRDDSFKDLQSFTDRLNTGVYDLVQGNTFLPAKTPGQTFIKYRSDEYRIAVPRDAVVDNSLDIFDAGNLDQNRQIMERIKGDFAHFRMTYDNTPNYEFLLKFINTIFNVNIR